MYQIYTRHHITSERKSKPNSSLEWKIVMQIEGENGKKEEAEAEK